MKKTAIVLLGILFVLGTLYLSNPWTASAEDSRMIRIFGKATRGTAETSRFIRMEPEVLTIEKGGTVIWLNWARTAECLKIVFEDGKKCADVTDAPTGFSMDASCYVTSWITMGGTSSLRFTEAGTYEYLVKAPIAGKEHQARGKIVVLGE